MNNFLLIATIFVICSFLCGCSNAKVDEQAFESIDAIIARHTVDSADVIERPQTGYFIENSSLIGLVGQECSGSFRFKGNACSFKYPKVDEGYYVVTPLIDKQNKISLLVTLRQASP